MDRARARNVGGSLSLMAEGATGKPLPSTKLRARILSQFDRLGRWADEGDACRGNSARKTGIFRQEAVAWMQCAGTNSAGSRYDLLGIEISRYRRPPRDLESDIGERYCRRCSIDLVIDDRRAQTKLAQRANDPDGNLAPVGDQDGLERKGNSSH